MFMITYLFVGMSAFLLVWLMIKRKPMIWKNITAYVNNCKERTIYLVLFFGTIVSQFPIAFTRYYPVSADELYTISNAMFFAGYDVSPFMHLKKFYNFGYSMLMTPLYQLLDNPITIFRVMLICNAVVHAVIMMITYYIIRKKLKCTKCVSITFTLVCSANALMLCFREFMYNEIPLALIDWLTVLLLIILAECKTKKRVVFSLLLGILMAYAYIIHSRCLILYLALTLVVVLYLCIYRKLLVEPVSFVIGFAPCYWVGQKLLAYVKEHLYLKGAGEVLTNSVEKVASGTDKFGILTSLDGIKKVIAQLFSLSGSMTLETAGFLTVATVVVLYYLIKNFKKICKGEENKTLFILNMFATLSLWGMVAAIAVVGAGNGKVRFLYYSRYFVPFIGPFLLAALYIMKYNRQLNMKRVAFWSGAITIGVCFVYVFYSYPILKGTSLREITSTYFFRPFALYQEQGKFSKNVIVIVLAALIVLTCVVLYLYNKHQVTAVCMMVMLFSVVLVYGVEKIQLNDSSKRRYEATDELYEICTQTDLLEEKRIMCTGIDNFGKSLFFALYDQDIVYDKNEFEFNDDTVVVGKNVKKVMQHNPEYIFKLDNNEWIGFWDDELNESFADKYQAYVGGESIN